MFNQPPEKPPVYATQELFRQLETIRQGTKISIARTAFLIGCSELTYKNWKNKDVVPLSNWEPKLREAIKALESSQRILGAKSTRTNRRVNNDDTTI